ncbi:carbohydrate-binding domain-containing protein, partial [bacterium]|nr:carbohydrate-binding domain-containing protein [bacterium]
MKNKYFLNILFALLLLVISAHIVRADSYDYEINLSDVKKTYEYKTSFDSFKNDYSNKKLADYYITDFLFDGIDVVKSYDLDDYVKYVADGGDAPKPDVIGGTVVNINSTGNYLLSGTLKKGMIAINTNGLSGEINIYLDNVTIDTEKKKWPAIYVYNNDINYDDVKVTIIPLENTKNYITGGRFKKTSLMDADSLSSYSNSYSNITYTYEDDDDNDVKTSVSYNDLASYYGIYTKEQMGSNYENILFARVKADQEGLRDGDPTIYYKGSGAISSDIALTFNGAGYLSITSYNKEGVETKGDLTFSGGIGDYVIYAYDDCLNTTTSSTSSAYGTFSAQITIDVNSLYAVVAPDAEEGDAIDSNGALILNGGTIIALAHPYSGDGGLDAAHEDEVSRNGSSNITDRSGIHINGGTVIATGIMSETPQNDSEQSYLFFDEITSVSSGNIITIVDSNNNPVFAYATDRELRYIVYSDSTLNKNVYNLYVGGKILGTENTIVEDIVYYTNITSFSG